MYTRIKKSSLAPTTILVLFYAILVFLYTTMRAANLSFTYDESLSFSNLYWLDTRGWTPLLTANTHFLNSLAMAIGWSLFGVNEFGLRLSGIIGHFLYLSFAFLITKRMKNQIVRVLGFVLLTSNPFVLDFFSLARGYGLSLGLTMGSIYFLLPANRRNFKKAATTSFLFCFLAILSNLNLAGLIFSFVFLFIFCEFNSADYQKFRSLDKVKRIYRHNKAIWILLSIFLLILSFIFLYLRGDNQLYFGTEAGIWRGTVTSVIQATLYGAGYQDSIFGLSQLALAALLLLYFVATAFDFATRQRLTPEFLILAILVSSVLFSVLVHVVAGVPLPVERTAIHFWLLFVLGLIHLFDRLSTNWASSKIPLAFLAGFSVFHLATVANLTFVYSWKFDSDAREAADLVLAASKEQTNPTIAVSWPLRYSLAFYFLRADRDDIEIYNIDRSWCLALNRDELNSSFYIKDSNPDCADPLQSKRLHDRPPNYFYLLDESVGDVASRVGPMTEVARFSTSRTSLFVSRP